MRLARKFEPEDYLGWTIEVEPCAPFRYEFYQDSVCFGQLIAHKDTPAGMLFLRQPMWIPTASLRGLKTPIQKESAMEHMLDLGRNYIRGSIWKWKEGVIRVDPIPPPPEWTAGDWDKTPFRSPAQEN